MSDLPLLSLLNHALYNYSQGKTNYSLVTANYLRVLQETCREILDYTRVTVNLELSGAVSFRNLVNNYGVNNYGVCLLLYCLLVICTVILNQACTAEGHTRLVS